MKQSEMMGYTKFMDICRDYDLQPNKMFACIRKALGISQSKLAYWIDKDGITQNVISKYEHKNNVKAEQEYILWCGLMQYLNIPKKNTKANNCRYATTIITAYNLYILNYANDEEVIRLVILIARSLK